MLERMRALSLFESIGDAELARLAARLSEQRLAAGEVLFRQGDAGHTCYVLLSGELEVVAHQGAFELQLEICQPGRMIGEMAIIDTSPRSATVRALQPSRVAALDEPAFLELLGASPTLMLDLLRSNTLRLRRTSQHMIDDLATKHAELARAYDELEAAQAERIRLSRIDEELAVARRIQALFLPRTLPQPPGWQLAAFNRGAHEIGGDFFDCIRLPDGALGLVLADVCGKGVPAALFVALTRSLVRASSLAPAVFQQPGAHDLDALLRGALWFTNSYIAAEHGASNMFITLFYAVLEPLSGRLAYANAGHNSPWIIGRDGGLRHELASATLPLGIVAGQSYTASQAAIAPGELLVGFTDGITEAMSTSGELFGEERLLATLQANAELPPAELVQAVVAAVDAHAGGAPQADDMTLLVVRRDSA